MSEPLFWENTPLDQMSREQWESLCDGCARCCLHKLQDVDTGDIHYTSVACSLLDERRCRCRDYAHREERVPDCVVLASDRMQEFAWLPDTCAYRLLAAGQRLPSWHPLISGDPDSVARAGISVRGRVVSEDGVHEDDLQDFIVDWVVATRAP